MSFDGIVLRALSLELKNTFLNAKIDKVYQPEADEIILNIRGFGKSKKLLMSASSSNPRVHITTVSKENPMSPPMFCMLLRKHLQGGRIVDITQMGLERILAIDVENRDELGVMKTKRLLIEIMGRHSNIMLIDLSTEKIMDAIKRVPIELSSVRQTLPGAIYILPPNNDKLEASTMSSSELFDHFKSLSVSLSASEAIFKTLNGISPLISREICTLSNINGGSCLAELNDSDIKNISDEIVNTINKINNSLISANMYTDTEANKMKGFSVISISQFEEFECEVFDSTSEMLEAYFEKRDRLDRIRQRSLELRKTVTNKLERAKKKLVKQAKELDDAKKRDKFQIYGELITANIYKINRGDEEVECLNYYSENSEMIKIKLDKKLSPSQNAQKYFKKYAKLKTAHKLVSEFILETKDDIKYLENVLYSIENAETIKDIDEIKEELNKEGFIKLKDQKKKNKKKEVKLNFYHYVSSDGIDIFIGRNNTQNDLLSMKFAEKNDLWLHTKDIPGSHVILKCSLEDVSDETLIEAAMLAAHYSKAKGTTNVAVDYTERKNLRKPNGSKPGMVIYDTNWTVYVTPDESKIFKLKKLEN